MSARVRVCVSWLPDIVCLCADVTALLRSYFEADGKGNVVHLQQGVIRTNCMDNLDRTNVVQVDARACGCGCVPACMLVWVYV